MKNTVETVNHKKSLIAAIIFPAALFLAGCEILFIDGGSSGGGGTTATVYHITYDDNGGTGGVVPIDSESYVSGENAVIATPDSTLEKTGYVFNGWTEASDGTGTIYFPNATLNVTKSITLYARWISNTVTTYTITYSGNGFTSGTTPSDPTRYTTGQTATAARDSGNLMNTGEYFSLWNTASSGNGTEYYAGDSITITDNVELFAQYAEGRLFYAHDFTDGSVFTLTGVLRSEGTYVKVYADNALDLTNETAAAVADEFDANVYQMMIDNFGSWEDMDNNEQLIILLQDILDGATENSGYVAGYFYSGDMYSISSVPSSNQADMINMDVNPGVPNDENFNSTLAHELQHLINFSVNELGQGIAPETWLNEGLSTAAEYVYSGIPISDRVSFYNNAGDYSIAFGNNFFVWDGYWENEGGDQLSNYTTAYMFFQWLRIHATNGTGIYKDILHSGYGDYRAVTTYAESRIDSQFSDWTTLLRTWYAANLCNDSSEFYGYKGELKNLTKWVIDPTGYTRAYLYPGEGIITSNLVTDFTPLEYANHVSYAGITEGSRINNSTVDSTTPYTGTYTLGLNSNTTVDDSWEYSYFPVASVSGERSVSGAVMTPVQGREKPEAGSYPIDALLGVEGVVR